MPRYFEDEDEIDESLVGRRVRPDRRGLILSDEQRDALVATVRAVLTEAPIPSVHRAALESLAEYDGQVRGVTLILH